MRYEDFLEYKSIWLLWRNLGHVTEGGSFVPPISFMEADQLPKVMLDVFFELDSWIDKMMRELAKRKQKNG